jgi:hypothetical protein
LTKTQIDRLGARLRKGEVTDADLQFLDTYRCTFAEAYENVLKGEEMLFLIEYDRPSGRLVGFESVEDSEREMAADSRLALELSLNQRGIEREVVLLEASTEDALRRTHRRYFEDLVELVTPSDGMK